MCKCLKFCFNENSQDLNKDICSLNNYLNRIMLKTSEGLYLQAGGVKSSLTWELLRLKFLNTLNLHLTCLQVQTPLVFLPNSILLIIGTSDILVQVLTIFIETEFSHLHIYLLAGTNLHWFLA